MTEPVPGTELTVKHNVRDESVKLHEKPTLNQKCDFLFYLSIGFPKNLKLTHFLKISSLC